MGRARRRTPRPRRAALYGHYLVLPGWLTGPEVCQLEHGGCAVCSAARDRALLGVPNALLGVMLYAAAGVRAILRVAGALLFADDPSRARHERVPRLEPDLTRTAVPHLLDRPYRERAARGRALDPRFQSLSRKLAESAARAVGERWQALGVGPQRK